MPAKSLKVRVDACDQNFFPISLPKPCRPHFPTLWAFHLFLFTFDMNALRLSSKRASTTGSLSPVLRPSGEAASKLLHYNQIAASRSLSSNPSISTTPLYVTPLRSKFLPDEIRISLGSAASRGFHNGSSLRKEDAKSTKEVPVEGEAAKKTSAEGEKEKEKSKDDSEHHAKDEAKDESKDESEGEGKKEDKKEPPPPPPPHGDKSPWQVFTETLQTEFKASKEWNESTKALAAGAQQFTENESVRRAREAYTSTTGAVSSTAGTVLKSTAGAVGKGAAWTWETPVVKGVRTGVNATASVIEKGTRPIRETEAFKNVKNVIDDGSSSRYGGWVEKEERRKARELREMQAGRGKRVEVAKEDPE